MPTLLESILYTPHPLRCAAFYQSLLGLRPIGTPDEHMAALRIDERSVLLLFDPEHSSQPGRSVPSHGARGPGHVAFVVDDLDACPIGWPSMGWQSSRRPPGPRATSAPADRSTSATPPATRWR